MIGFGLRIDLISDQPSQKMSIQNNSKMSLRGMYDLVLDNI